MTYHEFPKALYKHGEYMAVSDAEQEAQARVDGWDDWASDHARSSSEEVPEEVPQDAPKRRGRPPKVQPGE